MEIKQLFKKDIARPINGVVKADQTENETVFVELDEYVITNELKGHIENFFKFYMPSVHNPEQASVAGKSGIWVSGFFGSGKSHFIKILSYLLQNIETTHNGIFKSAFDFFADKLKDDAFLVGDIEKAIQKQNKVILFNIDSRADTDDGEHAILKVFLKVFNEQMGYSGDHAHIAHLERDLDSRGQYQNFQQKFAELTGEKWLEQRDSFDFYRDDIAEALSTVTEQSLESTQQWVNKLEENFPLDIANFCKWVKEYLDVNPDRRILFFVDEVGQFIGQNTQMMLKLQTITENLGTICGGKAWVIVTSQEDIDAVLGKMQGSKSQDFSKIQGRFERISLSSSNTNEVIEKRLLEKNEDAKGILAKLYEDKGDIIRAQLSFEKSNTAELANYTDTDNFVKSYPFIPYHYNLVQKIFSGISRAGASGQHMSKGERSLIDAFQIASNLYSSDDVGRLIPIYSFYNSIKKFLDTAVVRDINQAAEKDAISDFAINVLQTLFMIRYVDEVKSTIDNLVTLCINEVDQDKRALRLDIEKCLGILENNLLIARQGDEYIFLTNEEKEIEKEIQNTDIESSDETNELSRIIFDEILRRNDKYRYPENKQDFPISRSCNGQPFDRNLDTDLKMAVISPIDADYDQYNLATCTNRSAEGILIKLADKPKLFDELRTYIKTEKYIRKTNASGSELEQLRRDKANENMARRKRLVDEIEDLIKISDFYALGSEFDAKGTSIAAMLDAAYRYVIENTFSKLKLIKPFAGNITQEIQQTLAAGDTAQFGLDLNAVESNPLALQEVEQHISMSDNYGHSVTADDIVKKFTKRPFGWNTDEILLLLARLGLANKITFQFSQQDTPLNKVYEYLSKSQKRASLRIRKIKQQSEGNLRKAAKLYKDLSFGSAPSNEKELYTSAETKLKQWYDKLKNYKSKASTGQYPGKKEIDNGIELIAPLISLTSSYQFIECFINSADDLMDFEEDFSDLENFYETQFATWQNLEKALKVTFAQNRALLEKNEIANSALTSLKAIYQNPRPYRDIRNIQPLIENVTNMDNALIENERQKANQYLQNTIADIQKLLDEHALPADLCNKALFDIQQAVSRLKEQRNVAQIQNEQRDAEHWYDEAEQIVNNFNASKTPVIDEKPIPIIDPDIGGTITDPTVVPPPVVIPKAMEAVSPLALYNKAIKKRYIETPEDIDKYIEVIRQELLTLVNTNHKVRIK